MASLKQLAANRANAKKSTGPRSPKGKAVSRFNALKFGITAQSILLPNESVDHFEALAVEYAARFRPQTPEQRFLVKSLVTADWFTDRLNRTEPEIWKHDYATTVAIGDAVERGGAFIFQHYSRLRRCHATLHRTYLATMKALHAEGIRAVESQPDPGPEAELGSFCTSSRPVPITHTDPPPESQTMHLVPREKVRKVLHKVIREAMRIREEDEPAPRVSGDRSSACPAERAERSSHTAATPPKSSPAARFSSPSRRPRNRVSPPPPVPRD